MARTASVWVVRGGDCGASAPQNGEDDLRALVLSSVVPGEGKG